MESVKFESRSDANKQLDVLVDLHLIPCFSLRAEDIGACACVRVRGFACMCASVFVCLSVIG